MQNKTRFHLAFPVDDLDAAREFYGKTLGCRTGRSNEAWQDFDFYGHQIVAHLTPPSYDNAITNPVDGKMIPVRHFGLILSFDEWEALSSRLTDVRVTFLVDPYIRFNGEAGEQGTFFVKDPAGNALEFKAFRNEDQIFATTST